ncbi:nickel ABC transporter permease subunit NikC [Rhodococcus opacus PD630]|uniref:ABC transporter permease n=1 Tax=Rhodococcus TaxID=1827 RepID=UPI00029CCBD5|nr:MULTISPECIES: ABC transporter permease [Rhodococcus]AHK33112.1 Glutathione transport system permease protein gsiD [Rhodococcus opacus PD630]EHI40936.1 nickel ABC transporter permease subunit NikC [Rhodococcus opacus PD630]PBC49610.1 ABC transporter permease [Rhodococcus sp. ACPA1]UDG95417.1 ABC transporter permease [Rhodococcus opacus PD630]
MLTAILRYHSARAAAVVLGLIVVLAVFGPALAPFDPLEQDTAAILQGPSGTHWLGTDNVGRDVFSRLLAGSTVSVLSALQCVVVGFLLGVIPGFLSVYLGRGVEWFTLRLMDALITLPFLVFAVAMTALLGNGLAQAMFAVGILIAPAFYRVTRAAALTVANSQYVEAAELMGADTSWIIRRHAVRKVLPAVGVTFAAMTGASLVIVSSLTFLGIGVVPPDPTWGGLLASGLQYLYQVPFGPVVPALLIVATVWALNAIADALRDATGQPRRRARRKQEVTSDVH